jgi:hypothetical protein
MDLSSHMKAMISANEGSMCNDVTHSRNGSSMRDDPLCEAMQLQPFAFGHCGVSRGVTNGPIHLIMFIAVL